MTYGKLILAIIVLAAYLPWTYHSIKTLWLYEEWSRFKWPDRLRPEITSFVLWWVIIHFCFIVSGIAASISYYWNTSI